MIQTRRGFHDRRTVGTDGFTLLEMVISIAIVALISVVLSQIFISTLRSNTKTEILKDVKQNGELAQETMVRMIQNARSITSACSDTGTVLQSLTVVNADDGESTFGCVSDGSAKRIASTSASGIEYLTADNITLGGSDCTGSSLIFKCYGSAGVPNSISISFSLAQTGTSTQRFEQASETFGTTATMRNASE